ncbi:vesicle coat component [Apophysomyces ossiformis]|uniref:Protein transport protein sec16 n=1 Tax=Apophysomyces ossiformis TaxID=679940 RepID=A0A8H7BPP6_9FUNG|nr:vesicle coat component [Apophysomyces ossiformis]
MGGLGNINKIKGPTKEKLGRIIKSKKRAGQPAAQVLTVKVMSKKKQKQLEKAIRHEKRNLASRGIIEMEEEMKDVETASLEKQRVIVEIAPELLEASAAGPEQPSFALLLLESQLPKFMDSIDSAPPITMASTGASDGPIPFDNSSKSEKDDPFDNITKTHTPVPEPKHSTQSTTTEEIAGDASALFGATGDNQNTDSLFGNVANSAASFFDQHVSSYDPQKGSQTASFFDQVVPTTQGLEKELTETVQSVNAAAPNAATDPAAIQYDPGAENYYAQYQTFDPNVHYYYDEQGQLHYYDPNTNQEYDYSYEQYAQYYGQQGYDTQGYGVQTQETQYYAYGTDQRTYDTSQAYHAQEQQQQYDPNAQYTTRQADQTTGLTTPANSNIGVVHGEHSKDESHSAERKSSIATYADATVTAIAHQEQQQSAHIEPQQLEGVVETKYDLHYYAQSQQAQHYTYGQEHAVYDATQSYDTQQRPFYEYAPRQSEQQSLMHDSISTLEINGLIDQHANPSYEQPSPPQNDLSSHYMPIETSATTERGTVADQGKESVGGSQEQAQYGSWAMEASTTADHYSEQSHVPSGQEHPYVPDTQGVEANESILTRQSNAEISDSVELPLKPQNEKIDDHTNDRQFDPVAEYDVQQHHANTEYTISDNAVSQQSGYAVTTQQPATIPVTDQEEANPKVEYGSQLDTYDPGFEQPAMIPVVDVNTQEENDVSVAEYHPSTHSYDPFSQHTATIPTEEADIQQAQDISITQYGWEENVYDRTTQVATSSGVSSYDAYYAKDQSTEITSVSGHKEEESPNTMSDTHYAPNQQFAGHGYDRRLSTPDNQQYPTHTMLERSSTVPPPAIARLTSPQPDTLIPCPDANCEGENKPKAKFCCECGRPLAGISRSTTPAARYSDSVSSTTIPYHLPPMKSIIYAPTPPDAYAPTAEYGQTNAFGTMEPLETTGGYTEEIAQVQQELPPDPLNRSKGCPLVTFGFGGKICLMYPQTVQRFTASSGAPITKTMPSIIQIKSLRSVLGEQSSNVSNLSQFVGPVLMDSKAGVKSKKKDVLAYMEKRITEFKSSLHEGSSYYDRTQAKILLWEVVYTLIQKEGTIGDGDKMDNAIRALLQPPAVAEEEGKFSVPAYSQESTDDSFETDRSKIVLAKVQKYLLAGEREAAVQYAMQEDMWAHALIISSCVNKDLWKKVINGFIERELCATDEDKRNRIYHSATGDDQSLRVLYSLFSGSGAAAMNEFLKTSKPRPSVPYGNVLSTPQADETQLSKWRETLTLILANRTSRDTEAITALGDILKSNGWIEAAHICYILSPQSSLHSGADTPHARLSFVGGDNFLDLDTLYLSELFEFASSIKHSSATPLPFLQGYKLVHAWWLADLGLLPEAQRYCESIADAIKAYTKPSPYLHRHLLERLKEFAELCGNASGHGTDAGSWIKTKFSKGSLDSLWGSLEGKFNKFVSGDDTIVEEPQSRQSMEIMARSVSSAVESVEENRRRAGTPLTNDTYGVRSASPYAPSHMTTSSYEHAADGVGMDAQQVGYGHAYGYGYGYGQSMPRGTHSPFQHGSTTVQPAYGNGNANWWGGGEKDNQSTPVPAPVPSQTASVPQQPQNYNPDNTTNPAAASWNDDDDLGFGNSALNKSKPPSTETPEDSTQMAQTDEPAVKEETKAETQAAKGWGIFSLFSRTNTPVNKDEKKAIKANLGEENAFYYDEKEKRWAASTPAPAPLAPPPKAAAAPKPAGLASAPPTTGPPSSAPERVNSAPNPITSPPSAPPPAFNTPPPPPSGVKRAGASGRKPMRSRYVDVFNQNPT